MNHLCHAEVTTELPILTCPFHRRESIHRYSAVNNTQSVRQIKISSPVALTSINFATAFSRMLYLTSRKIKRWRCAPVR